MDTEMREEWLQDMRDEARAEEVLEHKLRADFDYFCDYNIDAIEQLNEAISELKDQCEMYGYEFEIGDFLQ